MPPRTIAETTLDAWVVHTAIRRQDRRDDEILRTRVHRALEQIHRSTQALGRSAGERGLPQPGRADDARVERRFVGGESKPGGFEALQGVPEIDPLGFVVVGWGEYQIHTINRHAFAHRHLRTVYRTTLTGLVILSAVAPTARRRPVGLRASLTCSENKAYDQLCQLSELRYWCAIEVSELGRALSRKERPHVTGEPILLSLRFFRGA